MSDQKRKTRWVGLLTSPRSLWRRRRERQDAARQEILESALEAIKRGDLDFFDDLIETLRPRFPEMMSREKAERLRRRDEEGAQRLRRREEKAKERERREQERQKKRLGLTPEEGGMDRYWSPD